MGRVKMGILIAICYILLTWVVFATANQSGGREGVESRQGTLLAHLTSPMPCISVPHLTPCMARHFTLAYHMSFTPFSGAMPTTQCGTYNIHHCAVQNTQNRNHATQNHTTCSFHIFCYSGLPIPKYILYILHYTYFYTNTSYTYFEDEKRHQNYYDDMCHYEDETIFNDNLVMMRLLSLKGLFFGGGKEGCNDCC